MGAAIGSTDDRHELKSRPDAGRPVVHLIDDDEAVRRSAALLLSALGFLTQSHATAEDFLQALPSLRPACLVTDVLMPGMDGLQLQAELAARGHQFPIIMVTGHGDVSLAVRAMKAGAVDFIEKPYSEEQLLTAVRSALLRVSKADQSVANNAAAASLVATLTPRERDVLSGLVEGRPNKVIAHDLGISPRTVEIHRAKLMEKLGCRSLAEALRIAITAASGQTPAAPKKP